MRKLLIPIVLVAGIVAGFVRAFEWKWAWDTQLWLMTSWHPASLALLAFCLVVVAIIWLALRGENKKTFAPSDEDFSRVRALVWVDVPAALALLAGAWLDISSYLDMQSSSKPNSGVSMLIFAILSAFAAVCVIVVSTASARGALRRSLAIYRLTPVIWGCFWLLRNISGYAINPVPLSFLYDMLAIAFTLLALYSSAGFFFFRANTRNILLYGAFGVFFSSVALLGSGFYWLLWNGLPMDNLAWSDVARFTFALLHLLALVYAHGGKRREKSSAQGRPGPMYEPYTYPYAKLHNHNHNHRDS